MSAQDGPAVRPPMGASRERMPSLLSALRPALTLLLLLAIASGVVYPGAITAVAQTLNPTAANGYILHQTNGSAYGSSLLGQNITNPELFWLRASLIDYQPFTGAGGEVSYGPTLPALLNLTRYYIGLYGLSNTTVPLDLVAPSASGLDPDLTPEAVLVQIPRVAHYSGLSQASLLALVQGHVTGAAAGLIGPAFVNVLDLDVALLARLPPGTSATIVP